MVAIRTITTKNKEGTIVFDKFVDDVQPIRILEQIWVTVTRVPRVLRAFLPLWAVGSIVGATQKVDMIHLRATGQVRILVAVMDAKKIPKMADVCAGCGIYRLYFKPDEAPQVDVSDPEDDDLLGDDDKQADGDRAMKDAEDPNPPQDNNGTSNKAPETSQNCPPHKQASLMNKRVDLACEQLLTELSIKVMLESDVGSQRRPYSPLTKKNWQPIIH